MFLRCVQGPVHHQMTPEGRKELQGVFVGPDIDMFHGCTLLKRVNVKQKANDLRAAVGNKKTKMDSVNNTSAAL